MHVTRGGEIDGQAVQHAEEEALPAAVAPAEHDVAVDGSRDVQVDLEVVRAGTLEEGVEGGLEGGVIGERGGMVVVLLSLCGGAEESVPGCGAPAVGDPFPGALDHSRGGCVEGEGHAAADCAGGVGGVVEGAGHLLPFFFPAPLAEAGGFDMLAVFDGFCGV